MVATFNGWDEMREIERETLDLWETQLAEATEPEDVLGLGAATELPEAWTRDRIDARG
jgi:DNA-binding ferritin-like protein (Dps family)